MPIIILANSLKQTKKSVWVPKNRVGRVTGNEIFVALIYIQLRIYSHQTSFGNCTYYILSMIRPLNCMFSGHLIQNAVSN